MHSWLPCAMRSYWARISQCRLTRAKSQVSSAQCAGERCFYRRLSFTMTYQEAQAMSSGSHGYCQKLRRLPWSACSSAPVSIPATGASDIAAFQQFLRWPQILPGSSAELRAIDNVHAKVWICDSDLAIVGSGNATPSGLDDNLEYGMLISEPEVVAQILRDWDTWWEKASVVEESSLEELRLWLEQENKALQEIEVQIQEKRKEIERKIGKAPRIGRRIILHPETGKLLASRTSRPPLLLVMESSEAYGESASSLSS